MKNITVMLLILITKNIFAYPIDPLPLRKLVIESEFIVYANVIRIDTIKTKGGDDTKAILKIKEVIQGELKDDTIGVFFSLGIMCPPQAQYEKGTTVLAFLYKDENAYRTEGLSFGSKKVDATAFQAYKKRILEMQNILLIKNKAEKDKKTIDWLIDCAVNPNTRWEGVFELSSSGSDFMANYFDKNTNSYIKNFKLSNTQKIKLRKGVLNIKELTCNDMTLIDFVLNKGDTELINFLIKKLKESNIENNWCRNNFIKKIAKCSNKKRLVKIAQKLQKLYFEHNKDKEEKLVEKFMNKALIKK